MNLKSILLFSIALLGFSKSLIAQCPPTPITLTVNVEPNPLTGVDAGTVLTIEVSNLPVGASLFINGVSMVYSNNIYSASYTALLTEEVIISGTNADGCAVMGTFQANVICLPYNVSLLNEPLCQPGDLVTFTYEFDIFRGTGSYGIINLETFEILGMISNVAESGSFEVIGELESSPKDRTISIKVIDLGCFDFDSGRQVELFIPACIPIPTLEKWGLIILSLCLFILGRIAVQQKVVLM